MNGALNGSSKRAEGILLAGGLALVASLAGCWSSSSSNGTGGKTGSGGSGAGGTTGTGGSDGGTAGAGGKTTTDASADQVTGAGGQAGGGAGGSGAGGSGGAKDAAIDTAPCVSSVPAGFQLLFPFNGGANGGWYQFLAHDDGSHPTTSLGASYTDGHNCPGALLLAVNFTNYPATAGGQASSGATETFYASSPNGLNWGSYKALHAWVKVQSADVGELANVYFYVKSHNNATYQSAVGDPSMLGDWTHLTIDLTAGNGNSADAGVVGTTDVQLIGFELLMKSTRSAGEPATPSPAYLLIDDIYLESATQIVTDASTSDASGQ